MARRRRLDDEQRDELRRGSNHFGEQAARAFLDGALDVALGSSDRAIRDHEALVADDPHDREVLDVLADRLRDRAEFRRHAVLAALQAGRDDEARTHADAGIADGERAIELHEQVTDAAGPFPLWVPSVRLLLAEMYAAAGRPDAARRQGDEALDAYRRSVPAPDEADATDADGHALALAHALLRHADVLAHSAPAESLALRRASVDLVRHHAHGGGPLWRERHEARPTWASVPSWRQFAGSAYDLALALAPPRADVAGEALLALQDAVEGYAALVPDSSMAWLGSQVHRDMAWLQASVHALVAWLEVGSGHELAAAYEAALARLLARPGTEAGSEFAALRPRLLRHLG